MNLDSDSFPAELEFHVETRIIQVDFSEGRSVFAHIAESIEGNEIGLLGKIK